MREWVEKLSKLMMEGKVKLPPSAFEEFLRYGTGEDPGDFGEGENDHHAEAAIYSRIYVAGK